MRYLILVLISIGNSPIINSFLPQSTEQYTKFKDIAKFVWSVDIFQWMTEEWCHVLPEFFLMHINPIYFGGISKYGKKGVMSPQHFIEDTYILISLHRKITVVYRKICIRSRASIYYLAFQTVLLFESCFYSSRASIFGCKNLAVLGQLKT